MARNFYVSLVRGRRVALLAGPFTTHAEALEMVSPAVRVANDLDPWSHFDAFGTMSAERDRPGVLNRHLGLTHEAAA